MTERADLAAAYFASHVELGCRHLPASAGAICAGEALRVRDGRAILFDRVKRHPTMMLVEPNSIVVTSRGRVMLLASPCRPILYALPDSNTIG